MYRGLVGLALPLIIALAVAVAAGPAAARSPAANLKSCLKKTKKIEDPTRRKKAKQRCRALSATPIDLVRATLTWDSNPPGAGRGIDLDLWAFAPNGSIGYYRAPDLILDSTFSGVNGGSNPGTETFTDRAYFTKPVSRNRNFSFGVCDVTADDGSGGFGTRNVIYQLDYVTADGVHHTGSGGFNASDQFSAFYAGTPIPSFCPEPGDDVLYPHG